MKNTYLASKPRYEILDGLRGVAAVMVVLFHIFECYSPGVTEQIINHGYLSVDFFFALSGFVIAYAYDDRWNQMNLWTFLSDASPDCIRWLYSGHCFVLVSFI